jgi:tripartite-type tricarboxylate transporter receptor subunit TctC
MMTRAPQVHGDQPEAAVRRPEGASIAYAKKNPGKLNYASSGNGSIQHIAGELFKQLTGTFITHIPVSRLRPGGAGPDGQGRWTCSSPRRPGSSARSRAGKLKGLAVTSASSAWRPYPACTTAEEAGSERLHELDSWFALYAPAGTPADVVQQLNTEIGKVLTSPEIRARSRRVGHRRRAR